MKVRKKKVSQIRFSSKYWDLQRDGVSPSGILQWLNDREVFRLNYVEGWYYNKLNTYIEFGNIFHHLHEKIAGDKRVFNHRKIVREYVTTWIKDHPLATPADKKELELKAEMVLTMLPTYLKYKGIHTAKNWWSIEDRYTKPIEIHPGIEIPVHGMLDGLYGDKRKRNWLYDMKNKGKFNLEKIEETLLLDIQMMLYAVLAEYAGYPVFGIDYDVVRIPTLQKRVTESTKEFCKRLQTDVEKRPSHYFHDVLVEVPAGWVKEWEEKTLKPILKDMYRWATGNGYHYSSGKEALLPRNYGSSFYDLIVTGKTTGYIKQSPFTHHKEK